MKRMVRSYNKSRGDISSAVYAGVVNVFYAGETSVDPWGRASVRMEQYWTPYGDGDTRELAAEIAAKVGGEVREEFFDPQANGGRGYLWRAGFGLSIVVVSSGLR